jgi:hypothetical protein
VKLTDAAAEESQSRLYFASRRSDHLDHSCKSENRYYQSLQSRQDVPFQLLCNVEVQQSLT